MEQLTENQKSKMKELEAKYREMENDMLENGDNYTQEKIDKMLHEMDRLQNEVARVAHNH